MDGALRMPLGPFMILTDVDEVEGLAPLSAFPATEATETSRIRDLASLTRSKKTSECCNPVLLNLNPHFSPGRWIHKERQFFFSTLIGPI